MCLTSNLCAYLRFLLLISFFGPICSKVRVGFLSDGDEEKSILDKCLSNTSIELVTVSACHNYNGIENVGRLYYRHKVSALIGSPCDKESRAVSLLAYRWRLPFLSTSMSSLQEREITTLAMVPDNQHSLANAISVFLSNVGVRKVTVVYTHSFRSVASLIEERMLKMCKLINFSAHRAELLNEVKGVVLVLADEETIASILQYFASIRGLYSNTRIIVFSDSSEEPSEFFSNLNGVIGESLTETSRKLFLACVVLLHSKHYQTNEDYALALNLTNTKSIEQSLLLCDAVSLLNRIFNYTQINAILEQEFTGISGPIFFSRNGARLPYLNGFVWEWDEVFHAFELTPSVEPCNFTAYQDCSYYKVTYHENSTILSLLSLDVDACEGGACGISYAPLVLGIVILGIFALPFIVAFRYQRREKEMYAMTWRIAYENVRRRKKEEAEKPGFRKLSATSCADISTIEGLRYDNDSSVAYLNDQKVFIKTFRQKRALNFTKAEMKQLNQLKLLTNTNVNTFIGMSFNQRHEMLVVWKHCSRGSLDEIIFEKNHRFGRTFQGSFLKHILSGLQYIHNSPIEQHGSLFLSNCVVDSHWVVKLTDFGIQEIIYDKMDHRELSNARTVDVDHLPIKFLQLPPEMMRNVIQEGLIGIGTKKADIYQLGMIMYQILFHIRPFSEKKDLSSREMVTEIYQSDRGSPCYPSIPEDNQYTLRLVSIMQQCWSPKLDVRPELYAISDAIAREFEKEGKGNVIDQMVRIIDDYQENLDSKVFERTKFLEETLEKTQNLLFQIFPKNVAEELREGYPIQPVMHLSVSLLFADICKFTELCDSCIPVHVIDILQDLYSSFDRIVSEYQAFKVENVGDNYLLVSGLDEIPKNHLEVVCKIALQLMQFIHNHETKHRAEIKLEMKVGINCGAVACGILGSSAPRFCIFGDTLNMACHMAGSSEPGRIQITEGASRIIRERYPQFQVEERGLVDVKGKGPVTTYWLTGRTSLQMST